MLALRKDLAFQAYNLPQGEVVALYSFRDNTFTVYEDDAAWLAKETLKGRSNEDLLQEVEARFGTDAISDASTFLDEFSGLVHTSGGVGTGSRTRLPPVTGSQGESQEDEFFRRCSEEHVFTTSNWELTYTCNLRCAHCYNPHHSPLGEVAPGRWLDLVDEARDLGLLRLALTGGEASLHPGFFKLVEKARSRFIAVDILTNGRAFSTGTWAEELASLFPRSIQFSLYGATPGVHDRITGFPGSWAQTIASLERFAALRVPIAIKCPAMTLNYIEIPEVAAIATGLGAVLQVDLSITARNDGNSDPTNYRLNEPQLQWLFEQKELPLYQGLEQIKRVGPAPKNPEEPICGAGSNGLSIQPDGTAVPCLSLQWPLGNVSRQSLSVIWKGERTRMWQATKQRQRHECQDCELTSYCSFCPGISLQDSSDPLAANPNDCRVARVRQGFLTSLSLQQTHRG